MTTADGRQTPDISFYLSARTVIFLSQFQLTDEMVRLGLEPVLVRAFPIGVVQLPNATCRCWVVPLPMK